MSTTKRETGLSKRAHAAPEVTAVPTGRAQLAPHARGEDFLETVARDVETGESIQVNKGEVV